ncbi:hypothetical protein SCHPADRAFT_536467 [Schizopora paradoxa]|uniref:Uncharacterized protein n=1 Tax=Schizopora paradoxa TaxID=27342 RepID=A0A0H2REQ3_9AGAM|nr:hypothetical protein SCHPADRAFT_536467 [Schizopora paradoxa]
MINACRAARARLFGVSMPARYSHRPHSPSQRNILLICTIFSAISVFHYAIVPPYSKWKSSRAECRVCSVLLR